MKNIFAMIAAILAIVVTTSPSIAFAEHAYLEITMKIGQADRNAAASVYTKYKQPFLSKIPGAQSKELLIRGDDVQVLHRFATQYQAEAYLKSELFTKDIVVGLTPYFQASPEIRVYSVFADK